MNDFAINVLSMKVPENRIGVFFLGQAGFVFKLPDGRTVILDPYLSDCCDRYFSFKRLMPQILSASELKFDYLLVSHAHFDHFDPDSVPELMAGGKTKLVGAKDTAAECERLGIKENLNFLACGDVFEENGLRVTAVPCDHGAETPYALGFLIETAGHRIYFTGDTAYRPDLFADPVLQGVDLLLLPINGAFGNLNEEQAAQTVKMLRPGLAIPCHYWNFAEHGGDPGRFAGEMKKTAPDSAYRLMRQGEGFLL